MTNPTKNTKFTDYLSSIKEHLNCPLGMMEVNSNFHKISNDANNGILDLPFLKETIATFKLANKKAQVSKEQILSNFNIIKKHIDEGLEIAAKDSKPLLVILGESHFFQGSLIFENLVTTYLSDKNWNQLLAEADQEMLKFYESGFLANYRNIFTGTSFAKHVLDYNLYAIDPANKVMEDSIAFEDALSTARNNKMNKAIAQSADGNHKIAIVGAHHINHIIKSKDILDKFTILPFDISFNFNKLSKDLINAYLDEDKIKSIEIPLDPSVIQIDLTNEFESFSLGQIYDIYQDLLPDVLGNNSNQLTDTVYKSNYAENPEACESYAVLNVAITTFDQFTSQHTEL